MRRVLGAITAVLAAALALPAVASATATLVKDGSVWRYTAAAGEDNSLSVGINPSDATRLVFLDSSLANPPGCFDFKFTPIFGSEDRYGTQCPFNAGDTVEALMGDGNDFLNAAGSGSFFCFFFPCLAPLTLGLTVEAGAGNDSVLGGSKSVPSGQISNDLRGGDGDDTLTGGPDDDKIDAGAGRDTVSGLAGADDLHGGAGIDEASYAYATSTVLVSFDEQANDGQRIPAPHEGDNVRNDIEDLRGGSGDDILNGTDGNNTLSGGPGKDQLEGLGGFDSYYGEDGDDTIRSRDGNIERVDCGDGGDVATIDTADKRSGCETVLESDELQGDLDGDGVREPVDCNDRDADIKPGANDVPDNGVDENCDGADASNRDRDGDGFAPPFDCDDANAAVKPGAREIFGNATDEDCSGKPDPLQTIFSFVRGSFQTGTKTRVRRLQAVKVNNGTVVRIGCTGRGSAGRRACRGVGRDITVTRDNSTLDLRRTLRLRSLPSRVRLQILYLREDSIAKRFEFRFRRRRSPSLSITCHKVGTAQFAACP